MWQPAVSPKRGAGRCSAGSLCTGIPASSSAPSSARGSAGSATHRREGRRSAHSPARCPSTTNDVTTLPGRGYRCPAGRKTGRGDVRATPELSGSWRYFCFNRAQRNLTRMEDQVQREPDMFEYEPRFLSGATTNDYVHHLSQYHFSFISFISIINYCIKNISSCLVLLSFKYVSEIMRTRSHKTAESTETTKWIVLVMTLIQRT